MAFTTTFAAARKLSPAFEIPGRNAIYEPVAALGESGDLRVIQQCCALLARRLGKIDQQPRVVKLAIEVDNSAAKAFGLNGRQPVQRFLA